MYDQSTPNEAIFLLLLQLVTFLFI